MKKISCFGVVLMVLALTACMKQSATEAINETVPQEQIAKETSIAKEEREVPAVDKKPSRVDTGMSIKEEKQIDDDKEDIKSAKRRSTVGEQLISKTTVTDEKRSQKRKPATEQDYYQKEAEDRALLKHIKEEYRESKDKRAFLLQHADMDSPRVQMFVARHLREFDGPEVVEALTKLTESKFASEDLGSTARVALDSLHIVESKDDLERLSPDLPFSEQMEIINKYVGNTNAYGQAKVGSYLIKEIDSHPADFVPILVSNYAWASNKKNTLEEIIRKYPDYGKQGLDQCINSLQSAILEGCIEIIGDLKMKEYLPGLKSLIFPVETRITDSTIRFAVINNIPKFGNAALPFVQEMLYSKNSGAISDSINMLWEIQTKDALNVLVEFRDSYSKGIESGLLNQLDKAIDMIEERIR